MSSEEQPVAPPAIPSSSEQPAAAPVISFKLDTAQERVSTAFNTYDVRQRGWLYESNARSLLKRIIFAHHPDQDQLIDRAIVELQETATFPKELDVPEQKERRFSHDEFVRVVSKRIPEAKSAEEVASSFSALKNDSTVNVLARQRFVQNANGVDPAAISKDTANLAWTRVFGDIASRVEYQPYRSAVNSVIHSTKIESKA